jgi:hypothetical protein
MALKRNLTRFLNDIVTIKKESKEMDEGYYGSEYKKINTYVEGEGWNYNHV